MLAKIANRESLSQSVGTRDVLTKCWGECGGRAHAVEKESLHLQAKLCFSALWRGIDSRLCNLTFLICSSVVLTCLLHVWNRYGKG